MEELLLWFDVEEALVVASTTLELDLGKEGCETHKIVTLPFLAWMVVAAGTFQTDAEERLADESRHVLRLFLNGVEVRGQGLIGTTTGGEQVSDKLVVGLIFGERIAQPGLVIRGSVVQELGTVCEKVAIFQRPEVCIFRAGEECVHEVLPFGRRTIRQKRSHFRWFGESANQIQINTPNEFAVGAQLGGQHAQPEKLVENQVVDVVVPSQRRRMLKRRAQHNGHS